MKVITWNVKGANAQNPAWEFLKREAPDIALLQEVGSLPVWIQDLYNVRQISPRFFGGHRARFSTVILSIYPMKFSTLLNSSFDWVNRIHREREGWIVECETIPEGATPLRLVSVHSPAFEIPKEFLQDIDVSPIKLENNPDLWFTEILWSLLRSKNFGGNDQWVVGGDFNASELFDKPKDRGNRMVIDRMNKLGLTDCLSHFEGKAIPTFKHSGGSVRHQLDYCYVSEPLLERCVRANVPDQSEIFGHQPKMLSDHLPIICEFN